MKSIDHELSDVDGLGHGQLTLDVDPPPAQVDELPYDTIARTKTKLDAYRLCIALSGLTAETVRLRCAIDKAQWSRIFSGSMHFPQEKELRLMEVCGNEVPLLWTAYQRGYDPRSLRRRESELERELREAQEKLAALESEREIERRAIRELMRP